MSVYLHFCLVTLKHLYIGNKYDIIRFFDFTFNYFNVNFMLLLNHKLLNRLYVRYLRMRCAHHHFK